MTVTKKHSHTKKKKEKRKEKNIQENKVLKKKNTVKTGKFYT